jgi:hypothetical protein
MNVYQPVGALLGLAAGCAFFFVASYSLSVWKPMPLAAWSDYRFSGVVESHDADTGTLTLTVPSVFPGGNAGFVRFSLDDDTLWSSINYLFTDSVLAGRDVALGVPGLTLPKGAFVSVLIDAKETGTFTAKHVTYLRKSGL